MTNHPFRPFVAVLLLGVFCLSLYLFSASSDLKHNGDTALRYQTTQAMVDHHRLWLQHPVAYDTRVSRGRGGHLYAFYAPGQAVFMAPLYLVGKFVAHHLSLPYDLTTLYAARSLDLVLGALLAMLFFYMALSVGYSPATSIILALILAVASSAWPDAQSALEQTQVNLMLLLAVYGAWRFVRDDLLERKWLALAATGAGLAFFTRYDALVYLPIVGSFPLSIRLLRRQHREFAIDGALYLLVAAPWLLLVGLWNYARFGSPFLTGLHERTFGEPILKGMTGLLVSPGKGLIWYFPLVFVLPWVLKRFHRRSRPLTVFLAALVLGNLLLYSNVLYWHGDPAWGPRYLYVVLPYLVLPLGELLGRWKTLRRSSRAVVALIVASSLLMQVCAVSVSQWRYWYRLQVAEARTSQPFRWGASYYHYYWNVRESPIAYQFDNVYQVTRLALGDGRYRLTSKPPDPLVGSNPAQDYPINTAAFWWADTRHPLLGATTRAILAGSLAALVALSLAALLALLRTGNDKGGATITSTEATGGSRHPALV